MTTGFLAAVNVDEVRILEAGPNRTPQGLRNRDEMVFSANVEVIFEVSLFASLPADTVAVNTGGVPPSYRCDIAEDEGTQSLFSANLGATGLTMVHGYGTAETYGLEVDQEPVNPGIASRDMIVHGAYALAMWDPGSLFGYSGISV